MSEPEWVDVWEGPSVADERWLTEWQRNGSPHEDGQEDSWLPRNLAEVPDEPPVLPTLGGLNLLYPGKRHVFSGPQESAKTLAAYVAGLAVVREGGRVLLIDFEMGERDAKRRLCELGASSEELGMFDYVEPAERLTGAKADSLVKREPQLVIIDASAGAYDLQGLDDNKRGDVERFASLYIRPFWRAEIATLTIDHVVKNTEQRGNYAIGSERKVGGTDVHLGFSVLMAIKRGSQGKYQITTHKDRGGFHKRGKLATFELQSHPDTHHFEWAFVAAPITDEEHPFRPTHLMEKVSRFLERQIEAVSRNVVEEEKLGGRDYVRIALDLLTEENYLEESEGPRRARLVTVNRVYREHADDFAATSPDFAENLDETTSPLRRTPYGGGEVGEVRESSGEVTSPNLLDEDDGIPF